MQWPPRRRWLVLRKYSFYNFSSALIHVMTTNWQSSKHIMRQVRPVYNVRLNIEVRSRNRYCRGKSVGSTKYYECVPVFLP